MNGSQVANTPSDDVGLRRKPSEFDPEKTIVDHQLLAFGACFHACVEVQDFSDFIRDYARSFSTLSMMRPLILSQLGMFQTYVSRLPDVRRGRLPSGERVEGEVLSGLQAKVTKAVHGMQAMHTLFDAFNFVRVFMNKEPLPWMPWLKERIPETWAKYERLRRWTWSQTPDAKTKTKAKNDRQKGNRRRSQLDPLYRAREAARKRNQRLALQDTEEQRRLDAQVDDDIEAHTLALMDVDSESEADRDVDPENDPESDAEPGYDGDDEDDEEEDNETDGPRPYWRNP